MPYENHSPDVPHNADEQHELFVHIGIWRRVVMRNGILSSVLDVCQNILDSHFFCAMAGFQFGTDCTPRAAARPIKVSKFTRLSRDWPSLVTIPNQANSMKVIAVLISFPLRWRHQPVAWEISCQNPGWKRRYYDSAAHLWSFASSPPEKEGLGDQLVRVRAKSDQCHR